MGVTKTIVSAAISEANRLHVESWRDGLSFSAALNRILDEHRYLCGMGIVARELSLVQVLSIKGSKGEEEEGAA